MLLSLGSAKEARELKNTMEEVPSVYVGESGCSIQERSEKH